MQAWKWLYQIYINSSPTEQTLFCNNIALFEDFLKAKIMEQSKIYSRSKKEQFLIHEAWEEKHFIPEKFK